MDLTSDHHEYCTGDFDPDDIVISGIAGRFPECDNVGELKEGLYKKKNFFIYSDTRYEKGALNAPYSSVGIIRSADKFDADFFCCSYSLANKMDPETRMHMEVTYEAIADAGYDATQLAGKNIGIFNATTQEDANKIFTIDESYLNMHAVRSMHPNRTSYTLDLIGPSMVVDAACTSSNVALWTAVQALKTGTTEAAVVSGCQLNLLPDTLNGYIVTGIATKTGNSRPFEASSDGMLRTESVCALFLQKAKYARRAYATIKAIEFLAAGYVTEGISVPSEKIQKEIMLKTLEKAKVDPDEIDFVEAHGTGTQVGDPIEIRSLHDVFCINRKRPLFVGSLKSNIGHTEACSGVVSMIKAIFSFENNLIPPNVNYNTPNPKCTALVEGKIVVVTDPMPFDSNYMPINSFGFGGTLVATVLKKNLKTYENEDTVYHLPRLVLFPASTEEAIRTVFQYVQNTPGLRNEFFVLVNQLAYTNPVFKPFRGYALFQEGKAPISAIKNISPTKRQVWFVMVGMGCQWPGMGLELMKIDVFAKSMRKSAESLKAFGIDLFEIVRADQDYLQRDRYITPSFVGIAAVQIALVDLLKHLGINPDGIVGHSTGELICAYADGCFTAEQTIISAYLRGHAVDTANLPEGGMAAVGISWSKAQKICPEGIYPACDNSEDSVTISGLKEPLKKFAEKLSAEDIFIRLVNTHGYAFHCKYIHPVASELKATMKKLIPSPKPRSERWISSSFVESEWSTPECKTASADYFVHNLLSSVRFKVALKKIPADAIVIEIGPHFLLQSLLKRSIGAKASYFGLMKRNAEDNINFFMESIGKIYNEGVNPDIERLYPSVKFPVPRGTPSVSDLIRWNHTQSFKVPKYTLRTSEFSREFKFDKDDAYILDHKVDGRSLFPASGYMYLAWEALAAKLQKHFQEMPVLIENFKIHRATIITQQILTKFFVNIMDSSGHFEIIEGKSIVASGYVFECKKLAFQESAPEYACEDNSVVPAGDIYDELKRCRYEFGPAFQGVVEANFEGTSGLLKWDGRWIPYLDSHLFFYGLVLNNRGFCLPTGASSIKIDPNIIKETIRTNKKMLNDSTHCLPVNYDERTATARGVGVEISHLTWEPSTLRGNQNNPTLEEYTFVPYISSYAPILDTSIQFSHYCRACNDLMNKIGKQLNKDVKPFHFQIDSTKNDYNFESVVNDKSDKQSLLKILQLASDNSDILKKEKKSCFLSYSRSSGKDILNNSLVNEGSLRIILDIISENTFRKLSVVELISDFPVISIPAAEIMKKYSHLKFKKNFLIAPKTFIGNQELLNEHKIEVLAEESLKDFAKHKEQDIAIGSFMCGNISKLQDVIHNLASVVKSNGFIIFFYKERANSAELFLSSVCGEDLHVHSRDVLEKILRDENLMVLSKISDPFGVSMYLLRSPSPHVSPQTVLRITDDNYKWVEKVKKELYEKETSTVWLLADDSPVNGIIGMVRCLKQETGGERIRCVFITRKKQENNFPPFDLENPFYEHLVAKNLIMNVWKNGSWGSFRHFCIKQIKTPRPLEHSYVNIRKFGDLSSFEWMESNVNYVERKKQKFIHIYYSALNFRDVMLATGKLSLGTTRHQEEGNSVLGLEFSGREEGTGKRFCGFNIGRSMATCILAKPEYCLEVPENWTLEEAATVPIVYSTCYYSLIVRAKLLPGESILIHSGTGGIGLAAINIALSMNCEVFTTVGNEDKREFLKKKYPQIKEENIGCSRNTSFENVILKRTNGKGVDVILNSLADDKFQANFRCIARSGRILEIGKYDLSLDRNIGSKVFLENVTFHGIVLDKLLDSDLTALKIVQKTMNLVQEGIKNGVVKPLDRTVFARNAMEGAFRYMAKGVHVGKVLLKIRDEEREKLAVPKTLILKAVPETQFYHNKVYIIIGGLGGFGIEVTRWISERGGKNIILTSRYGARTPYHFFCLSRWTNKGLNVQISTLNVGDKREAEKLLQVAARIGPVGGIFNSAVVLKDAFMDVQTEEDYKDVCSPKSEATKILDELTRKMCPELDYFVCFSSISCGRGNAGQTNYGYANSVMERVCEERRSVGLHGLAIQWGIIGEVGVVHRHMGDSAMISGVTAQTVKSCLEALDIFCQQDSPVVTSYIAAEQTKKSIQGDALSQILKILGVEDISQVNTTRRLGEMGIDSMVGVEIKQMIEYYSDQTVSMQEIQEMKIDDFKTLFEKIDFDKSESQLPTLMTTINIKLPAKLIHEDPLITLNKDGYGEPVFIVHTGDTDIKHIQTLAKIIKRPVYALVWTKDLPSSDIESLATFYLKTIENTANGSFHLMGHLQGGCVAFEMALQSEKSRIKLKTLTLLVGSEDLIQTLSTDSTDRKDPEITALCGFVEQFVSSDIRKLKEELQKVSSLDQRINTLVNYLTVSSSQTVNKNEVTEALYNYLQKYKIMESYIPNARLSMDINLLENPSKFLANDITIVKELFSQFCSGKVSIHRVFSPQLLSSEDGIKRITSVLQNIL